jgi:hypothetical protein
MKKIIARLNQRSAFLFLCGLAALSVLAGFYIGTRSSFPDSNGYLNMAKGFHYGKFSSWYFLPVETPETLRTWGYPFFIYLCQLISKSTFIVQLIQLLLHFGSLALLLRMIRHFNPAYSYRNIFLILLIPNIQIAYYSGQIASEAPNIFFIVLFFYIWYVWKDEWKKYLVLGLVAAAIFQLRPVFLAFPFFLVLNNLLIKRKHVALQFMFLAIFTLLLLPFGFWNKKHHGIFKITPLEGGAGAAHLGYWGFKLPAGYSNTYYWTPTFYGDLTQPSFVSQEEKQNNIKIYEDEWKFVIAELQPFFTKEDSIRMSYMANGKGGPGMFITLSGQYANARESLLRQVIVRNIKANPGYYLKTRLYTLVRMWFTGINAQEYAKANSLKAKIQMLYPFLVTFTFIFCGLLFLLFALLRGWLRWDKYYHLILLIVYFGIVHVPFLIQARYTVPVHMFILLLTAMVIGDRIQRRQTI